MAPIDERRDADEGYSVDHKCLDLVRERMNRKAKQKKDDTGVGWGWGGGLGKREFLAVRVMRQRQPKFGRKSAAMAVVGRDNRMARRTEGMEWSSVDGRDESLCHTRVVPIKRGRGSMASVGSWEAVAYGDKLGQTQWNQYRIEQRPAMSREIRWNPINPSITQSIPAKSQ